MALDIDKVSWATMKTFVDSRGLSIQVLENTEEYTLVAIDSVFKIQHSMDRTPSDTTDLIDFETNYLPNANGQIGLETFTPDRKLRVAPSAEPNAPAGIESVDNSYNLKVYWKDVDGPEIVLDPISSPVIWTDIFSITGKGKFFSFKSVFNSCDLIIRFVVDGKPILEISGESIEDLEGGDGTMLACPEIYWSVGDDKALVFEPKVTAITYSTNFKLQAHARGDNSDRKCYGYTVSYTGE